MRYSSVKYKPIINILSCWPFFVLLYRHSHWKISHGAGKKKLKDLLESVHFYSLPPPYLSCGTANQYSCFLSLCAYCCIDALACETNVFLMGFPTLRHRNLWDRCRLFSFVREEPISKEKVSYPQCTKELNKIISPFCIRQYRYIRCIYM